MEKFALKEIIDEREINFDFFFNFDIVKRLISDFFFSRILKLIEF